jgi:hypothetical protein
MNALQNLERFTRFSMYFDVGEGAIYVCNMRLEILTTVKTEVMVFWVVIPRSDVVG